jgi:hypothetical protein
MIFLSININKKTLCIGDPGMAREQARRSRDLGGIAPDLLAREQPPAIARPSKVYSLLERCGILSS